MEADLATTVAAIRALGLEGLVAKRFDSRYAAGKRSTAWLKHRFNRVEEFVVGGYLNGDPNSFRLLLGVREGKRLRFVKKLKNGFTAHARRELLERFASLASDTNPFVNLPEPPGRSAVDAKAMTTVHWLKPKVTVEVEFVEWTSAGKLRHARFRRLL